MTAHRVRTEPDAFAALAGLAVPAPAHHRRSGPLLAGAAVVVVLAAAAVLPGLVARSSGSHATVAATGLPQREVDRLAPEDAERLVVDPASTRLLAQTPQGTHYLARTPSGELCLVRVPDGAVPTVVCVPDRVGADATIGTEGAGQVRLVADGAPLPATADGWRSAGPNVWVRD